MKKVVGIVGNFNQPSRTYHLVKEIVERTAQSLEANSAVFNLARLGKSFPVAQSYDDLDAQAKGSIQEIISADVLVVGVPTWNSSYPGMFKHLFDLLPITALVGKPVILSATGGSERHALMMEYQLRPLFNYFKALSVSTSIFVTANDCDHDHLGSILSERIDQAIEELNFFLLGPVIN